MSKSSICPDAITYGFIWIVVGHLQLLSTCHNVAGHYNRGEWVLGLCDKIRSGKLNESPTSAPSTVATCQAFVMGIS